MNLEQIDTSTTAGKAEVMRLAAEGRRVAYRDSTHEWEEKAAPAWNWVVGEYAIISEPVGPNEVWHVIHADGATSSFDKQYEAVKWASRHGASVVRYIRADLAGGGGEAVSPENIASGLRNMVDDIEKFGAAPLTVDTSLLREAIAALTPPEGHVVVTRNEAGQAVAVTRQDDEGRILSVIAEFEGKWQPIESAPKDGTAILLTNGKDVAEGQWYFEEGGTTEHRDLEGRYIDQTESEGYDGWLDWDGGMQPDPTHWMPLPSPPEVNG